MNTQEKPSTKTHVKMVPMFERYTKEGDKVYLHRRIMDEPEEKILTPYHEIPWIEIDY